MNTITTNFSYTTLERAGKPDLNLRGRQFSQFNRYPFKAKLVLKIDAEAETMDVLFKYVTAARAFTCIPEVGDGTLRATQPGALNDPFECSVVPVYVVSDEREENRQLAEVLTSINDSKPMTEEDVIQARINYGSLFTRQLFAAQVSTRFGIVSSATNPRHPLMWSHYTTDGSGFVIGYDVTELEKFAGSQGTLRSVDYQERPGLITGPIVLVSPWSNLPIILSVKSHHWSYEDEWRLIVELNKTIGTGLTDEHGLPINLLQVPNDFGAPPTFCGRLS